MRERSSRADWDELSALDPYWAILSEPDRRFGGWEREEFLRSGRVTIDALLRDGARHGLPLTYHDALDFGCGAGRLTRALSERFDSCVGIDISPNMVQAARELNAGVANCRFAVHHPPDLSEFPRAAFDLVLSRLVLQHVPGADAKTRYIGEFLRVLRRGGLLSFQLPNRIPLRHRIQPRPRLYGMLRRAGVAPWRLYKQLHLHPIRMSCLPRSRVLETIEAAGGRVLDVREEHLAGGVISSEYLVTRA